MNTETYDALEDAVNRSLADLANPHCENPKRALEETKVLMELLLVADKQDDEYRDKSEHRNIEDIRNKATAQIERDKISLTWQKVSLELVKAFGPMALQIIAFGVFQARMLRFEEEGRFTSSVSREMHLPNLWNLVKR